MKASTKLVRSYVFTQKERNTLYSICQYIFDNNGGSNSTTINHYTDVKLAQKFAIDFMNNENREPKLTH